MTKAMSRAFEVGLLGAGLKVGTGFVSRYLALLGDGFENLLTNTAAPLLGLVAAWRRDNLPADHRHPAGHGSWGLKASWLNGLALAGTGLWLAAEGLPNLAHPEAINLALGFAGAGFSLLANTYVALGFAGGQVPLLRRLARVPLIRRLAGSEALERADLARLPEVKAVLLDNRLDLMFSLFLMGTLGAVAAGLPLAAPLASVAWGLKMAHSGWGLAAENWRALQGRTPTWFDSKALIKALEEHPDVQQVGKLEITTPDGSRAKVVGTIVPRPGLDAEALKTLNTRLESELAAMKDGNGEKRFQEFSTFQLALADGPGPNAGSEVGNSAPARAWRAVTGRRPQSYDLREFVVALEKHPDIEQVGKLDLERARLSGTIRPRSDVPEEGLRRLSGRLQKWLIEERGLRNLKSATFALTSEPIPDLYAGGGGRLEPEVYETRAAGGRQGRARNGWHRWRLNRELARASDGERDLDDRRLSDLDLSRRQEDAGPLNLSGIRAVGAQLVRTSLRGQNLADGNLSFAYGPEVDLRGTTIDRLEISHAQFPQARMQGATGTGVRAREVQLGSSDIDGLTLAASSLYGARLQRVGAIANGVELHNVDAQHSDWTGATLRKMDVQGTNLAGATFQDALIGEVVLNADTRLSGLEVRGARLPQTLRQHLEHAGVDLSGVRQWLSPESASDALAESDPNRATPPSAAATRRSGRRGWRRTPGARHRPPARGHARERDQ